MAWRRILALALTTAPALVSATTASAVPVAGQGSLDRVVLRGSQVGPGYTLKQRPDGHGAQGYVTLDMCGFTFRSEQRRTDRLQVNYVRRGTRLALSNEVVTYEPGGAQQAMNEVVRAIKTCPRRPVRSTIQGVPPLTYRITRLSTAGRRLLPGAIAFKVTVSGTLKGKRLTDTTVAVYERLGDVLSGVYAYRGSLQQRLALALHAGAQSALNLKKYA